MELTGHLDLLDRQADFFRRVTDDRELLVAIPTLLDQIYGDLLVRDVIRHLEADADSAIDGYEQVARSVTTDLRRVAEDFAASTVTPERDRRRARDDQADRWARG